jgi:hypothetical protein
MNNFLFSHPIGFSDFYQSAQLWIKDLKGRVLFFEDIRHWQKTIVALLKLNMSITHLSMLQWGSLLQPPNFAGLL